MRSTLELALAYCNVLLALSEKAPGLACSEAQGYLYGLREFPRNFDYKATNINLWVGEDQLSAVRRGEMVCDEPVPENAAKVFAELRAFVQNNSDAEPGVRSWWVIDRAGRAEVAVGPPLGEQSEVHLRDGRIIGLHIFETLDGARREMAFVLCNEMAILRGCDSFVDQLSSLPLEEAFSKIDAVRQIAL